MNSEATNTIGLKTIGVIGTGTMGRGIIQLMAQAGHRVLCFDAADSAASAAVVFVNGMISRSVEKGRITPADAERIARNMHACAAFEDLAPCDLVIEAIAENLDAKRQVFQALERVVGDDAILASNTSSLTIADIAAACNKPGRVLGLHFFNPVPLMKVVELVAAVRTEPGAVAITSEIVQSTGHRAVLARDQPGFLVNHAGRGLYTEGLRLLEEQVASHEDVDALLRDAAGFRMGPFELLDLTGLDVSGKVMESIYEQFHQEPRFRPSSLVAPRIAAGLLGRKTGEGWYRYIDGVKQQRPEPAVPAISAPFPVWIEPQARDRVALMHLAHAAGLNISNDAASECLLVVQPWGRDVTSVCAERGLDARRCVGVDPLPGLDKRRTLMLSVGTTPRWRDAAHALLATDGAVTVINDSPGFVVQRVLAVIVNIAANIAQRGIASVPDIEDAVKLGLGYPLGPLTWGDRLGGEGVLTILRNLQAATGDPRYRPSPWMVRRVGLGLSLLEPEASREGPC